MKKTFLITMTALLALGTTTNVLAQNKKDAVETKTEKTAVRALVKPADKPTRAAVKPATKEVRKIEAAPSKVSSKPTDTKLQSATPVKGKTAVKTATKAQPAVQRAARPAASTTKAATKELKAAPTTVPTMKKEAVKTVEKSASKKGNTPK